MLLITLATNNIFLHFHHGFVCCLSPYRGKGEPVIELSWTSCRQLLYQSVATILAHAGFECANESVLETLTDITHEYCLKFTKLLRFAVDREARLGQTPFPDVMEQVFHEVGIGSVLSLQTFWQHRIKDYHSYMLQVRREQLAGLNKEYELIPILLWEHGILAYILCEVFKTCFFR